MRKMIRRRPAKCANLSSVLAVERMCFDRRGISIRCFSVPAQEGLAQPTTRKAFCESGTSVTSSELHFFSYDLINWTTRIGGI